MEAIISMEEDLVMDSQLLGSVYRQYHKKVYNYISFRINNHFDAEELASLAFEKAVRNWERYNPALPIEGWLIGIAKNTVTDYLRSKGRRSFVPLDNIIELVSTNRKT